MFERCLICREPFPETGALRHLPRGDRVAYDAEKGRLWVVCRRCRRWNLVPLEDRWEVLEELEALLGVGKESGGRTRLLSETANVALFKAGPLEVIRIGGADYAEEASWRYGRSVNQVPGAEEDLSVQAELPRIPKFLQARGIVWRGKKSCPACQYIFTELPYSDRNILVVRSSEGTSLAPTLIRRCPRCRDAEHGGLHLEGLEAELVLLRLLAFEHHSGAPMDRIRAAARMVQDPDGAATLVRILTRHGRPLGDIPPVGILALEMVTNAAREATLVKMELAELTFRWRQEEELAALVDGELTPFSHSAWDRLVRRVRGKD